MTGKKLLAQVAAPEGGCDQRPAYGVLAPAELENRPPVHGFDLPVVVLRGEFAFFVLEDALDVLVTRDDVTSGGLVPQERRVLTHQAIGLVRIPLEIG